MVINVRKFVNFKFFKRRAHFPNNFGLVRTWFIRSVLDIVKVAFIVSCSIALPDNRGSKQKIISFIENGVIELFKPFRTSFLTFVQFSASLERYTIHWSIILFFCICFDAIIVLRVLEIFWIWKNCKYRIPKPNLKFSVLSIQLNHRYQVKYITVSSICADFVIDSLEVSITKWSNTLKQFVSCCRRIVWVCLNIL